MEIRDPDWSWGKIYNVLSVGVSRGFRFIYALWVDYIILSFGSMAWGVIVTGFLLIQVVINLMYFIVSPVSEIPKLSMLLCGLPLHVILVRISFSKLIFLSVVLSLEPEPN